MESIDYNAISWKKEGSLYRADNIEHFCMRIADNFYEGKNAFHGTLNDGKKITFCTPFLEGALAYAEEQLTNFSLCPNGGVLIYKKEKPKASKCSRCWTDCSDIMRWPLIMEINAENYSNKLCESNSEGIVIEGPITLEDIDILYAPHINKIEGLLDPFSLKYLEKIEHKARSLGYKKEDLIDKLEKGKIKKKELRLLLNGLGYWTDQRDRDKKVEEFISALKTKLR